MEQRESAQNLEQRVGALKKRRDDAVREGGKEVIFALAAGAASAFMISSVAYFFDQLPFLKVMYTTAAGLLGLGSLMAGGQAVLYLYRSNLLEDKIAELKQLPDYKGGSDPKSQ